MLNLFGKRKVLQNITFHNIARRLCKMTVGSVFRMLQEKLEEPISEPPSPRQFEDGEDAVGDLASHITSLREEIRRLRQQLAKSEADCK